jgi:aspartyl-tRNA synthetase
VSYRTHLGGDLRAADVGSHVTLSGWVARRRDHGGLVFVDLRDAGGLVQLVLSPESLPEAHTLRNEFVIQVAGEVRARDPENVNPKLATGQVEVQVGGMEVLARAGVLPFQLDDEGVDEPLRLRHRYLDLRRDEMRKNLWVRFKLTQLIRRYLEDHDFWELETPILYKSTPEGAKEFLVPTSTHRGKFYALPQSPQTYKQLYAIAGYERYYQIARCFRDEATRADRTQEFTQLDMELAFIEPEELFELLEGLFALVWRELLGVELETPFRHLSWDDAMLRYGSDKPELRFGCEISDLTEAFRETEFRGFRAVVDAGGVVRGFACPGCQEFSRKDFNDLVEFAKSWGGVGVAWLQVREGGEIHSPIAKFLSEHELATVVGETGAGEGDTVFLVADQRDAAVRVLGPLRLHLGERLGLIQEGWNFAWVTGFPMFEWLPDENRWKAAHNPFSAPAPEWSENFDSEPEAARSRQYDLVLNGNEVGGGSRRNHQMEIQKRVFNLLGISDEEAELKFSFLLRALSMGAPPHGGIAFGLDRLAMLLAGAESLRDVTAFPKGQGGVDFLTGAPTEATAAELKQYGITVVSKPDDLR